MRYSNSIVLLLLFMGQTALAVTMHNVTVGGTGAALLTFTPDTVDAAVGDIIRFEFRQKNHTATQSSLEAPCVPLPGGFDSGFQFVADNQTSNFTIADLTVASTDPLWVFCQQANHCQQGMVFAVNPGTNFAAFKAAAAATPSGTATGTMPVATATVTKTGTAPTASTTGVDHKIIVGGPNILAFSPSNITAAVGDTITFEFHQKNHTVTASAFDTPCRALSATSTTGQPGFDSGFMPVADGVTSGFPTFTVTVNDTTPIWAYCRQATHCGQGMVFSANAVETGPKNFSAFVALAKAQNGTTTPAGSDVPAAYAGSYARIFAAVLGAIVFLS